MSYNTLVVLGGVGLLGVCAGLVGSFAVLRRRALMGDALAHAALPGVCAAFIVLRERSLPAMLLGGFLSGLLGVVIVGFLRRATRIKEDAALGIVLSVFYGIGVVLLKWIEQQVAGGGRAGLDSYILGQVAGMLIGDVMLIGGAALFCLVLIVLMYKEFQLVTFDAEFASVQGWPAFRLDLLLMALVAVTVIIGLPAVGVVLMAALLIVPPAAARFWTDRLGPMLLLSAVFGLLTGVSGAAVTAWYALPSGPMIVLAGAVVFLASLLGAPHRGLIARQLARRRYHRRVAEDKLLRTLYELSEDSHLHPPRVSWEELSRRGAWTNLEALTGRLAREGLLKLDSDGCLLTDAGRVRAAEVTRRHRLWRLLLTEYPESAGALHDLESDTVEERLSPEIVADLEAKLRRAGHYGAV